MDDVVVVVDDDDDDDDDDVPMYCPAAGWDIVEALDTATNSWTMNLASVPTPRYGLCAATVGGLVSCQQ